MAGKVFNSTMWSLNHTLNFHLFTMKLPPCTKASSYPLPETSFPSTRPRPFAAHKHLVATARHHLAAAQIRWPREKQDLVGRRSTICRAQEVIAAHKRTSLPDRRLCIVGSASSLDATRPPTSSSTPPDGWLGEAHRKPTGCQPGLVGDTGSEVATTSSRRHHAEQSRSARDHLVQCFFQNS
jgi:hypothetical protein